VELKSRLDREVLIPDIVFTRPARSRSIQCLRHSPLLCVEVISLPIVGDLYNKCLGYLRWGVSYCWIVDPSTALDGSLVRTKCRMRERRKICLEAGEIKIPLSVA